MATAQAALSLRNINLAPLSYCEQVADFGAGLLRDVSFTATSASGDADPEKQRYQVLYSGFSAEDSAKRSGQILHCVSGVNAGQSRIILTMSGSGVLHVLGGFAQNPASGDAYVIYKHSDPVVICSGTGSTTTVIADTHPDGATILGIRDEVTTIDTNPAALGAADDGFWIGYDLVCILDADSGVGGGGNTGEARQISGFVTLTKTFTVSSAFSNATAKDDVFLIRRRLFAKNVSFDLQNTVIEREFTKNDLDAVGRAIGGKGGSISFDVELTGVQQKQTAATTIADNTSLTAAQQAVSPAWGKILKGCGFVERFHPSFAIGTTNSTSQVSVNSFSGVATAKFDEGCSVVVGTEMRFVESITDATNDKLIVYGSPNGAQLDIAPVAAQISAPSITYRPIDSDNNGMVFQYTIDNWTYMLYGCKGTFEISSIEKDTIIMGKFSFSVDHWLLYPETLEDGADTERTYEYNYQNSNPAVAINLAVIMTNAYVPIRNFSFTMNAQNSSVDALGGINGRFGFTNVSRKPVGTISTYPVSVTDQKEYRDLMAQNAIDFMMIAGSKLGEMVGIRIRNMRLSSAPSIQNKDGIFALDANYSCDAGGSVASTSAGGETKYPSIVIAIA